LCKPNELLRFEAEPPPNLTLRRQDTVYRCRLVWVSPTRPAALSGIDKADWEAIEQGWLPDADTNVWRSIAATLQVKFDDLDCAVAPVAMHFDSAQGL
jgi:hypothetical protein